MESHLTMTRIKDLTEQVNCNENHIARLENIIDGLNHAVNHLKTQVNIISENVDVGSSYAIDNFDNNQSEDDNTDLILEKGEIMMEYGNYDAYVPGMNIMVCKTGHKLHGRRGIIVEGSKVAKVYKHIHLNDGATIVGMDGRPLIHSIQVRYLRVIKNNPFHTENQIHID